MRSVLGVLNIFGSLLVVFALFFALPIAAALIYGEGMALGGFVLAAGATALAGVLLRQGTRRYRSDLKPRDAYLLVTLSWLALNVFATLPLLIVLPKLSFTRAYFEAMSGLSTTGATVLSSLDKLPHAINLWRHTLSWLGGMGIIVLAVAILPLLGVGGMQLYRAGAPGTVKDAKLAPRITETAKVLWFVYAGMTAACALALWIAGMPWFDAICHAFSTLSLGGFSTHDTNIGYFHSAGIELVMIVFMLLAAMNFATHFVALRKGDLGAYRRDPEARWMLLWVVASGVGVAAFLQVKGVYPDFFSAMRYGFFNLVSVATDGGFVTTDYGSWPVFAPMWMLFLSCVCATTGSTGSGIKMFRSLILIKQWLREMFTLVHPAAVAPLKISSQVVPNGVVYSVLAFIFIYFMTIAVLTFALLISGLDFVSAFSAIIACVNNIGPGLGVVGPGSTYGALGDGQLWICTAAMFLGRVEIITCAVLFTPTFWRK